MLKIQVVVVVVFVAVAVVVCPAAASCCNLSYVPNLMVLCAML